MKMPYEKPMMAIERYELTQTIADCVIKISSLDMQCVMDDPDASGEMKRLAYVEGYFMECDQLWSANLDSDDLLCYHTNAGATFTS